MPKEKDFYYKKSRLTQLRGFCAVVQSNYSITEASEKIHVEPATLSRQVSALERDLGIQLFDRSEHKKIKPTQKSDLFYKEAIEYINGIDGLFKNFNEKLKEFDDDHLNIASQDTAATYIFPKILGKMVKQKRFKNINIKIFEIPKSEAIKKLINKEIDLAFYPLHTDEKQNMPVEIEAKKNIKNSHILICNKNHPLANKKTITKEDIEKYDFLMRHENALPEMSKYFNVKPSKISFDNTRFETSIELVRYTDIITTLREIIFENGSAKMYSDIVRINVDNLFSGSYIYILTLKNSLNKDSVNFVLDELNKLTIKK